MNVFYCENVLTKFEAPDALAAQQRCEGPEGMFGDGEEWGAMHILAWIHRFFLYARVDVPEFLALAELITPDYISAAFPLCNDAYEKLYWCKGHLGTFVGRYSWTTWHAAVCKIYLWMSHHHTHTTD